MMRVSSWWSSVPAFVAACVTGLGLVGCVAQTELPPQVTENLTDLRDQLIKGKAQLQSVGNAARDLTQRPQAQLQPQIDRLIKGIGDLEGIATENRTQFASADERAQAYFAHWDKQLATMSKSLQEEGQSRRRESMETFEELKSRIAALKSEFRPFMSQLNEVARYLQTDATAQGVKTVTPQINMALDKENKISARADAVVAQIDAMRGGK